MATNLFLVGVAEIDITPGFPVELSGFALRPQPSTGVLDPIFARAMYLEQAGERLLWIACDVIAFEREFVEGFRAWAKGELGLESRQVLLSATHTHAAPATIHLNAAGRYSERYVGWLRTKLEEVARRAVAKTEQCDLVTASAEIDLAVDRRGKPSAHVDRRVSAIAWKRAGGEFVAACVNYAMHPVSLGRESSLISADWCGQAARAVSATMPGSPLTLVSNGAGGNLNPPGMGLTIEGVAAYGRAIGDAVVPSLLEAKAQAAGRLLSQSITVSLPLEYLDDVEVDRAADGRLAESPPGWVLGPAIREAVENWRDAMKQIVRSGGGRNAPIEIQTIRLGDITIVAVNGEMFSRFTDLLRRKTGRNLFVVGYANAAFGYIPTREAYAEGGYEVETAHFFYNSFRPRAGGLEILVERAARAMMSDE